MAAEEKTGARGLVSAIEKVLILFEKQLPSTTIKRLLVTPELVDHPEKELEAIMKSHDSPERAARFENAVKKEIENVKSFILAREKDFYRRSKLEISDARAGLVAKIYFKKISDVNSAFDEFSSIYEQIKMEESSLFNEADIQVNFSDEAIDELIQRAVETDQEAGILAYQLAKKLEYGLKLVKDRSGMERFVITREAVTDMEKYINDLMKKHYTAKDYEAYSFPKEDESQSG
jgi:ATP-dependent Clp protease ATP-binding subunit ClpX